MTEDNHALEDAIKNASEEKPYTESSEIGEVFGNLDNPKRINHNARLKRYEISSIICIDALSKEGIWNFKDFTTQFKELSVSEDGKGRLEKTQIASASHGADMAGRSGGFLSSIGNMFKRREE